MIGRAPRASTSPRSSNGVSRAEDGGGVERPRCTTVCPAILSLTHGSPRAARLPRRSRADDGPHTARRAARAASRRARSGAGARARAEPTPLLGGLAILAGVLWRARSSCPPRPRCAASSRGGADHARRAARRPLRPLAGAEAARPGRGGADLRARRASASTTSPSRSSAASTRRLWRPADADRPGRGDERRQPLRRRRRARRRRLGSPRSASRSSPSTSAATRPASSPPAPRARRSAS